MSLVNTYTFEEGTDGSAITTASSGAVAISGSPTYDDLAAIHGSLGANLTGASAVVYTNTGGSGQSSLYCKLHTAGSSPTVAYAVKTGSTFYAKVRFNNSNGLIDVTNGSNVVQGTSAASYVIDQVVRIDVQRVYSSPNMTITVALFYGSNSEGTTPDETLGPYTISVAGTPARDSVGPPVTGAVMYADTLRQYNDTTTWPAPFNPGSTASGTASIGLSASGGAGSTSSGSASLSLSATGGASGPGINGTASISLSASGGSPKAAASGAASLSLSASGTGVQGTSGSASLSLSAGAEATPHTSVTPQLNVNFDDGTTGGFNIVQGATVGSAYKYDGVNGVRLAPVSGTNYATLTYNALDGAGYTWAAFRGRFRIVTKTSNANTFTDLIEIGNELTVAPKGQFTVYTNSGDLGIDFNTTDFAVIDPAYGTGTWHLLEARVFFGATTYLAYVRYDGTEYVHYSANTQTASAVKVLWVQYPSTATDQTVDWDDIQFYGGNSDPGWLSDQPGASGTASISLSGSGSDRALATSSAGISLAAGGAAGIKTGGTASLTLGASGNTKAPESGSASISLSASGSDIGRGAGSASISLSASGTDRAVGTGTASLTLLATAIDAVPVGGSAAITLGATGVDQPMGAGTASIAISASSSFQAVSAGSALIALLASGTDVARGSGSALLSLAATAIPRTATAGAAALSLNASGVALQPGGGLATLSLGSVMNVVARAAGSANLALTSTGGTRAPDSGHASIALLGSLSISSLQGSGTGSITLNGSAAPKAPDAAMGTITLLASGSSSPLSTGNANLDLFGLLGSSGITASANISLNATYALVQTSGTASISLDIWQRITHPTYVWNGSVWQDAKVKLWASSQFWAVNNPSNALEVVS